MSRPEAERALALLRRADADLAAVRALETAEAVPDEIIGFHGQQVAEKLLKAILSAHGVDFPRTHSLRFLLDLLADQGLAPPEALQSITELYPFGVRSGTRRRSTRSPSSALRCGSSSTISAPGPRLRSGNRTSPARGT